MSVSISVKFEPTPNPATMKFNLSVRILDEPLDFKTAQEAERSPLASKIFGFPWTSGVFLGPQFVAVTKQDWVDWDVLAEPLAGLIREHLDAGIAILAPLEEDDEDQDSAESTTDSDLIKAIKRTIRTEIRPVVALDGGDVVFAGFVDGQLSLQMKGACAGCPSKSVTLKQGIEARMLELFPEIKEVVAV
jgi:Fe-S cluster biogenesis protein NfuA